MIARALCSAGHAVTATLREPEGRNAPLVEELRQWSCGQPGSIACVELDVTSTASVSAAAATVAELGGVDSLVLNAGVAAAGLSETFTADAVQRLFDVNVVGVHRVLWTFLPQMRALGGGRVVYISSTIAREVMPFLGPYCASKAALEALAEGWRYELNTLGIETVIVQPGTFPTTAILANLVQPDARERSEAYGELARTTEQVLAGIGAMVASGNAPDPQRIADEVVAAFAARGPVRRPVDPSGFDGAARINATCANVQADLLGHLGLSVLDAAPAVAP